MRRDRLVGHRPRGCQGCSLGACGAAAHAASFQPDAAAQNAELPNLLEPHRMAPLEGVNVVFIAAGAAACHRCGVPRCFHCAAADALRRSCAQRGHRRRRACVHVGSQRRACGDAAPGRLGIAVRLRQALRVCFRGGVACAERAARPRRSHGTQRAHAGGGPGWHPGGVRGVRQGAAPAARSRNRLPRAHQLPPAPGRAPRSRTRWWWPPAARRTLSAPTSAGSWARAA